MHPEMLLLYAQAWQHERWREAEHTTRVKQARRRRLQQSQQRVLPRDIAPPRRNIAPPRRAA